MLSHHVILTQADLSWCTSNQGCHGESGPPLLPPGLPISHPWALQQFPCTITTPGLFLQFLPKNLHLVCVDMPGHEGTTRSDLDDYSISGQAKRIHQVKLHHHITSAERRGDVRDVGT